jgi:hypothetical protein
MLRILVRVNPDKAPKRAFVGPSGRFCSQLQNLGSIQLLKIFHTYFSSLPAGVQAYYFHCKHKECLPFVVHKMKL